MSNHGGLPAIPVEVIELHWFEHELRRYKAMEKIYGKSFKREITELKEKIRNVGKATAKKPLAKAR